MSLILSFSLFFVSFAPLWVSVVFIDVLSIQSGHPNTVTEKYSILAIAVAFVACMIVILVYLNKKGTSDSQTFTLDSVEEEKTITAEYLLSYILPLFAFDFTVWNQVVLFIIYFSVLAFLCIRHNYFSVNVVLELLGYKFYKCSLLNDDEITVHKVVVSREPLLDHKAESIRTKTINNEYVADIQLWEK